jgi:sugar phosphate isomerase/epimerase
MYIALNGTLVAGRVKWPDFARLAAQTGYPGVDISLDAAMTEGAEATRRLLAELKLQPAVVGLPVEFRKDDEAFRSTLPKLEPACQFAVAIGCPRMTTYLPSSSDTPAAELRKTLRERFKICADTLARCHMRLGFEFISPLHLRRRFRYEFIWRMDDMLAFAGECGPNVGLLLDSWHWHHAGGKPSDILAAGRQKIVHVQAADAPDLPPEKILDNERLLPGEGILDWAGFFQALKKIGYEDGVSPEVFGRGLKDIPPEEGARLGLQSTRAVMKKVGVLE